MTKKNTPTRREVGQEITFDGGRWGIVDVMVNDMIWVLDQDGGEHELTEARID